MLIKNHQQKTLVVLDKEQNLVQALTEVAISQRLQGGFITGIGAVKDVQLGYYDLHKKDYIRKTFSEEDYELIALNGNITLREGLPYVHLHTAIGRSDFSVVGGHLFEAVVAVTAEVYITPFGVMPERTFNSSLGLATISHCPSHP
jgi:predicted DNA-binding protein with PD1-like motif